MKNKASYRVPVAEAAPRHTGEWAHGLCGCFDNTGLCVMAFFCPAFVFGQNAKHVGEDCLKMGICCMLPPWSLAAHVTIRSRIRARREIQGSAFSDIVYVTFCPFCALMQDTQEVHDMIGLTGDEQPRRQDSIVRI